MTLLIFIAGVLAGIGLTIFAMVAGHHLATLDDHYPAPNRRVPREDPARRAAAVQDHLLSQEPRPLSTPRWRS